MPGAPPAETAWSTRGRNVTTATPRTPTRCLVSCYAPASFVASDPHVHSRGCEPFVTPPASLLQLLGAQGIQVGAALVWGVGFAGDLPFFTGSDDPASGGGRILHYDLEVSAFAAARSGHLVALGLRDLRFSGNPDRFPKSGLSLPAWARAQGERVTVGMAHGQFWPSSGFPAPPVVCCMPWEFPVQAVRAGVSFLITERRGDGPALDDGTFLLWRTLLNSGFRIAVLGASDYPCIHRAIDDTSPRTDVIVNGPLTYEGWLQGIRAGRTVVTMDARHRLNLRVNGAPLGSEVGRAGGRGPARLGRERGAGAHHGGAARQRGARDLREAGGRPAGGDVAPGPSRERVARGAHPALDHGRHLRARGRKAHPRRGQRHLLPGPLRGPPEPPGGRRRPGPRARTPRRPSTRTPRRGRSSTSASGKREGRRASEPRPPPGRPRPRGARGHGLRALARGRGP